MGGVFPLFSVIGSLFFQGWCVFRYFFKGGVFSHHLYKGRIRLGLERGIVWGIFEWKVRGMEQDRFYSEKFLLKFFKGIRGGEIER